ncbi:STM3941 family protein [Flavobacterium reichenbachii]|uniref:Uncharacterized protein n=1 Tax=Flavobacterium reichenbachii TaxID=362418 RepID=A0A085ZD91_9FLAO|nr:STM3941 family protein [Flavobacterium reichenbachii]KFF02405.1 hypothetical protein IW19_24245 [Flavobacterium reichenbachii]OXB13618.1 hypothetical protein B0A68_14805 [Flavobacterium reichenbachii]
METKSLQFPNKIYINKEKARKESILFGVLTLCCLFGFWYGTGKFFTEDFYYPKLVIFMPICFVILLIETIKKHKTASNNDVILSLTEKGIQFFNKDYTGVSIVPWSEITGSTEIETGSSYFGSAKVKMLCVNVKTPSIYLDKIGNNSKKKLIKFNTKNNIKSIFTIESATLAVDMIALKKTIYQMVEKSVSN